MLAERFTRLVGMPPMQYLARWRMQMAANLLRTTTAGLAEIAERVGYGSEAALSRAFKRSLGVAPGVLPTGTGAIATIRTIGHEAGTRGHSDSSALPLPSIARGHTPKKERERWQKNKDMQENEAPASMRIATLVASTTVGANVTAAEAATPAPSGKQRLYLDVHELGPGKVNAGAVAEAHRKDLATQARHGVHYRAYWVDEKQGRIYCLVEAPARTRRWRCTARRTAWWRTRCER